MIGMTWTAPGATRSFTPFDIAAGQARRELDRRAHVRQMYGDWDGKHCAFLYSHQVLREFPAVPEFEK